MNFLLYSVFELCLDIKTYRQHIMYILKTEGQLTNKRKKTLYCLFKIQSLLRTSKNIIPYRIKPGCQQVTLANIKPTRIHRVYIIIDRICNNTASNTISDIMIFYFLILPE